MLGHLDFLYADATHVPEPALVGLPSAQVFWRFADRTMAFHLRYRRRDRNRYSHCNLVLYCENVSRVAVVSLCPKMVAGLRIDKLRRDTNAVTSTTNAAFKHIANAKLAPNLLHVD